MSGSTKTSQRETVQTLASPRAGDLYRQGSGGSPLHSPLRSGSKEIRNYAGDDEEAEEFYNDLEGAEDEDGLDAALESPVPYLERRMMYKQHVVLMLELRYDGTSKYKHMTLRTLLSKINNEVSLMDKILGSRRPLDSNLSQRYAKAFDSRPQAPLVSAEDLLANSGPSPSPSSSEDKDGKDDTKKPLSAAGFLRHRDLRRLEYYYNMHEEPSILVRRHAVVVSLDPIRCVVMANKMIVIVPDGADHVLELLQKHISSWTDMQQRDTEVGTTGHDLTSLAGRQSLQEKVLLVDRASGLTPVLGSSFSTMMQMPPPVPNTVQASIQARGHITGSDGLQSYSFNGVPGHTVNPPRESHSGGSGVPRDSDWSGTDFDPRDSRLDEIEKYVQPDEYTPYEAICYEAIFATVISLEIEDFSSCASSAALVHTEIKSATIISIGLQEQIRLLKNKLTALTSHVRAHKRALEELLDDDAGVAMMNLTKLKKKPILYELPLQEELMMHHSEMEGLMESFLMDFNTLQSKLEFIKSQIQTAEELVSLRLDTSRNQLLVADTTLSIAMLGVGLGSWVCGLFGMNLYSGVENKDHLFTPVAVLTIMMMMFVFIVILVYLRWTGVLPGTVGDTKAKELKQRKQSFASKRRNTTTSIGRPSFTAGVQSRIKSYLGVGRGRTSSRNVSKPYEM